MNIQILLLLIVSALMNMSCSKDDSGGSSWGIEEPSIVLGESSHLITEFIQAESGTVQLNDKIIFASKYEEEDISLRITSSCDENTQVFSSKIKSTILIHEILPLQSYLSSSYERNLNCTFTFLATNDSGDSHQFNLNNVLISLTQTKIIFQNLIINKFNKKTRKETLVKLGEEIFNDELRLERNEAGSDFYLVCKKSVSRLNVIKNEVSVDLCKVIFINNQFNINKMSKAFIYKIRPTPPVVKINNIIMNKLIDYGQEIDGFSFSITNKSNHKVRYVIEKKSLISNLYLQHTILPKYYGVRFSRVNMYLPLEPNLINEKGAVVRDEEGLYHLYLKPKGKVTFSINYKLNNLGVLMEENRLGCKMINPASVTGYRLNYPANINLIQVNENKINRDGILISENIIQAYLYKTYFTPFSNNYIKETFLCTDAGFKAEFDRRYPGLEKIGRFSN